MKLSLLQPLRKFPLESVKGAYTQDQVNIGWYGYETTKNASIRVGPGHNFQEKIRLGPNRRVGVQSVRNPDGTDCPPMRPAMRDSNKAPWVWVYSDSIVGWMMVSVLRERNDSVPWARGPSGLDFHVGLETCRNVAKSRTFGHRRNRVRTISADDVQLRYAARGTAMSYLQRGDGIRELYRRLQNDFIAVSVTQSRTTPIGTRGWVDVRSLAGEKASGIDVSVLRAPIDFHRVRESGEDFVVCKATEGETFMDRCFFENVTNARHSFLHVGAYHVLRPRSGRSGTEEAEDFIRALKLAKIGSTDIRPTVSVETSRVDRDETERYVGEFVGAMRMAGFDTMLYTYRKFLNWTKAFNTDLWIRDFNVKHPKLPFPWDDFVLWQYAENHVPGVTGKVCRNKCPDLSRIIQK